MAKKVVKKVTKKSGLEAKVERIQKILDLYEFGGGRPDLDIFYCADYIAWLAKYKKVPQEIWTSMADQVTRILTHTCRLEKV